MSNDGLGYEELVRDFYQALVEDDGFGTIQVEHNVQVTGKSGTSHQIDVLWRFELAGVSYQTAIECRQYKSRIKKTQVAAFHSILSDIGCTNGVIVTTVGFQTGAVTFAEHCGIRLVLVNPMLREIRVNLEPTVYDVTDWRFVPDEVHMNAMRERLGLDAIPFELEGFPEEVHFTDASGNPRFTLAEVATPYRRTPGSHQVQVDAFLPSAHGPILFRSIGFTVTTTSFSDEFVVTGLSAARAVLEDLRSSPPKYLLPDGSISRSSDGS